MPIGEGGSCQQKRFKITYHVERPCAVLRSASQHWGDSCHKVQHRRSRQIHPSFSAPSSIPLNSDEGGEISSYCILDAPTHTQRRTVSLRSLFNIDLIVCSLATTSTGLAGCYRDRPSSWSFKTRNEYIFLRAVALLSNTLREHMTSHRTKVTVNIQEGSTIARVPQSVDSRGIAMCCETTWSVHTVA